MAFPAERAKPKGEREQFSSICYLHEGRSTADEWAIRMISRVLPKGLKILLP